MQNSNSVRDALFPDCPIRNILSRVGDKWSLLVLNTLQNTEEPMRFNALQCALPDISQKVLTATLRTLEEDGMLRAYEFKWHARKANAKCPDSFRLAYPQATYQIITPDNIEQWL